MCTARNVTTKRWEIRVRATLGGVRFWQFLYRREPAGDVVASLVNGHPYQPRGGDNFNSPYNARGDSIILVPYPFVARFATIVI